MAEQAEIEERFARIEAALAAAAEALEAAETAEGGAKRSDALRDTEAELATARLRIETLERQAREREAEPGDAAEAGLSGEHPDVSDLESKLAALRAARAEDLTEMKALLAELEPLVEGADA